MKSTGVVRRIDGLGRVVLPKEIRKTLKLNSGDLLQIYTQKDQIVLEKYSPLFTAENSCFVQDTVFSPTRRFAHFPLQSMIRPGISFSISVAWHMGKNTRISSEVRCAITSDSGTTKAHIKPQSIRNVTRAFPPERMVKYAEFENAQNGSRSADVIVIQEARSRTASVVSYIRGKSGAMMIITMPVTIAQNMENTISFHAESRAFSISPAPSSLPTIIEVDRPQVRQTTLARFIITVEMLIAATTSSPRVEQH